MEREKLNNQNKIPNQYNNKKDVVVAIDFKILKKKGEEKTSSREKALEMIKKTREMLANLKKKEEMCNGTKRINCQS